MTWINRGARVARNIAVRKSGDDAVKRFLALTAVLFLLLRPMCDVWGAAHGHAGPDVAAHAAVATADLHGAHGEPSEYCCAKIQDGNLISATSGGIALASFEGWSAPSTSWTSAVHPYRQALRTWHSRDAPPVKLSYYARTSRILR